MQSVYLNGGYIGSTREYATPYEPISGFTYIDSVTAGDATDQTFVLPAATQVGDLCVLFEGIDDDRTVLDPPTGFTL